MNFINLENIPVFYQRYVQHVQHLDAIEALKVSNQQMIDCITILPEEKEDFAYAPGKWTIKELLTHIADAERIFAYRALTFSRNDKTPLPGFDENAYVPESNARSRTLTSIADELYNLRASTIDLFQNCSPSMLQRRGLANNTEITVLALAYVVAGHEIHHLNIIKERYLA
jgi:uncharacterized damage-inducible protein DinB